jgi:hypothetical protein
MNSKDCHVYIVVRMKKWTSLYLEHFIRDAMRRDIFTFSMDKYLCILGILPYKRNVCWVGDPPWMLPVRQQLPLTVPGIVEGRSVLNSEDFATALVTPSC